MSAYDYADLTARDVEFYVRGMYDLYLCLGGDGHCKFYDPLTIETTEYGGRKTITAHSYVMNLRDGGRHHPVGSLEQLASDSLMDFVSAVEYAIRFPDTVKSGIEKRLWGLE